MQHRSVIVNAYSKRSVLGLACEITFWLIPMQPASVFVLALHVVRAVL